MKTELTTQRQALVELVFERCMEEDVRDLDAIRARIRDRLTDEQCQFGCPHHIRVWAPTDYDLQIMVSRLAARETDGQWAYYPAYTRPVRYVSRARVMELARRRAARALSREAEGKLLDMLSDLTNGVKHFRAAHAAARAREEDLTRLVEDALTHGLGGEVHDD